MIDNVDRLIGMRVRMFCRLLSLSYLLSTDYVDIGPRFSNIVLQSLHVSLKKHPPNVVHQSLHSLFPSLPLSPLSQSHRLLILATTSMSDDTLRQMGLLEAFKYTVDVPYLTQGSDVVTVLKVREEGERVSMPHLVTLTCELILCRDLNYSNLQISVR